MKIALIGAGAIAKSHLDAFRLAGAEVVAVSTRSEAGKAFAEANQIPHFFRDNDELIKKTRPDGICILTQPSSYESILKTIKPYDIPVFLEKPVSYTVREAEALRPYLPSKVFVGLNRRFYGGVKAIENRIRNSSQMVAQLFLPERAKDIVGYDEHARNNWHFMNGIHGLDLLTYLVGSPKDFFGKSSLGTLDFTALSRFNMALYKTERDNHVMFMSDFNSTGGWRLHLFLPQEEIIFAPMEETKIRTFKGVETLPTSESDKLAKPGFLEQSRCFLAGIQQNTLPEKWVTFDDAMNSMRAIDAIFSRKSTHES